MMDPTAPQIPNRLYFRIGDVSELLGVEPYVLRFWETEFPMLQPKKGKTGHREYKRKDVVLLFEIKRLLYDEGFTIAGARKALKGKNRAAKKPSGGADGESQMGLLPEPPQVKPALKEMRREIQAILTIIKKRP